MRNTHAVTTKKVRSLLIAASFTLFAASTALGQDAEALRKGFWFNGGVGWGTADCEACDDSRVGGAAAVLAVGGTLSQRVLLGASSNVWVKEQDDVTLTVGALTAMIRFYPARTGHFYLVGGLGLSTREAETELGDTTVSVSENGTAALLGAGYDFRIAKNVSLSPFANLIGVDFDGEGTGFTQLGLSVTVH